MRKQLFISFCFCFHVAFAYTQYLAGNITDSIFCAADEKNSYCLFLPSGYTVEKTFPVIFIHDPGARGLLAAKVFENAAEKHQYILAASNITHNAADMQHMIQASITMQNDVLQKFSIDTSRMYMCGFSGGSRLSAAIAMQEKKYAGIIACGAGLPARNYNVTDLSKNVVYANVVGTYDMNYIEMHDLHTIMQANAIATRLFEFPGGHTWCDTLTSLKILDWLDLQAGIAKNKNTPFTDSLFAVYKSELQNDISENKYYELQTSFSDYISDAEKLHAAEADITAMEIVLNDKNTKEELTRIQQILIAENNRREEFVTYIQYRLPGTFIYDSTKLKNDAWWKLTANKLQKELKNEEKYEAESAARLYDFLWRTCWEQGDVYYEMQEYRTAKELFYLYTLVNANSMYAWMQLAETEALLGNTNAALHALETSINNGFTNAEYLLTDTAFASLKTNKKFIKFSDALNTKQEKP